MARELEAARVQTFLDARYKASDVKHSYRSKLGDTIDCIDFFAQAGVKALAARGTPIMNPPPALMRRQKPDAINDAGADEKGNERRCPDGTVPQVRITPEQIQRAGGLGAYLARIKKFSFSQPARSRHQTLGKLTPPEPGLPGYAHTYISGTGNNYTSDEAALSIFTPAIPTGNQSDHSLMQTWTTTGGNNATAAAGANPAIPCPANCQQTVEAGWTVDPGLNLDNNPHLFLYSTPDGYWTGCYNGSTPANISKATTCPAWVGLPSPYPPGAILPSSVPGSFVNAQQIFVWVGRCSVYHECENGWEVRVSVDLFADHYVPVGYYPDADFGATFGTASIFLAGGEVFEQAAVPSDTLFTLPMGSGTSASAGLGSAAYVANVSWIGAGGAGSYYNGGFGAPFSTVPTKYNVWENPNIGNQEIDLGLVYYLGAPVPAPTPAPPPPVCTPHDASGSDQFYVNPHNSPVQVEQGGSSAVNLILDGPWIVADHGNNAAGQVINNNLPVGSSASTTPASGDTSGHSYALMQFYVTVPPLASPGSYVATIKATDAASCVVATTTAPIQVLSCVPQDPQTVCEGVIAKPCGAISDGCGGTINCGACASAQVCSNSFCCPGGDFYNTALNTCEPLSCPAGTSFCYDLGECTTAAKCRSGGHCQKVGAIKECQ